jgi:hypothetical protein
MTLLLCMVILYGKHAGQHGAAYSWLQIDGNLVLKHKNRSPYWDTKSGGKGVGPYRLELRDDCVVVIRDSAVRWHMCQRCTSLHGSKLSSIWHASAFFPGGHARHPL